MHNFNTISLLVLTAVSSFAAPTAPVPGLDASTVFGVVKDNVAVPNAYQDEIDAASIDPSTVLGKRADELPATAAAIGVVVRIIADDSVGGTNAYQDEIDAADPAAVLGKRAADASPEDSIIIVRVFTDAYEEDVAAANSTEILGKRAVEVQGKRSVKVLRGRAAEDELPATAAAIGVVVRIIASDSAGGANAYQDEIDAASANPAAVLGKRTADASPEDSIIIVRVFTDAYEEDVASADTAEVLGKRM